MTVPVVERSINAKNRVESRTSDFTTDECVRTDTSAEALAALKPVFREGGTVTAGNSSPMSDGASALVLVSEDVLDDLKLEPLGRLVAYATAGVEPERWGSGRLLRCRRS